jgi:hypothetical protein
MIKKKKPLNPLPNLLPWFDERSLVRFTGIELEENIQQILVLRLNVKLDEFVMLHCLACTDPELKKVSDSFKNIDLPKALVQVTKNELRLFMSDVEKFQKKEKKSIILAIAEAKTGDRKSILKLVEWDKCFLHSDFVVREIARAQYGKTFDRGFLTVLSDIIRKKKRNKKEVDLLYAATYAMPLLAQKHGANKNTITRKLFNALSTVQQEHDVEIPALDDLDYFRAYLRRNGITFQT